MVGIVWIGLSVVGDDFDGRFCCVLVRFQGTILTGVPTCGTVESCRQSVAVWLVKHGYRVSCVEAFCLSGRGWEGALYYYCTYSIIVLLCQGRVFFVSNVHETNAVFSFGDFRHHPKCSSVWGSFYIFFRCAGTSRSAVFNVGRAHIFCGGCLAYVEG